MGADFGWLTGERPIPSPRASCQPSDSSPPVLAIVRARWQIENSPHWVLDATFKEDQSRPRTGHGAANIEASFRTVHAVSPGCVLRHYDCFQPRPVVAFPEPRDIGTNPYAARFKTAMYFMDGLMLINDGLFKLARFLRPKEKFNILPQRSLITLHGENIICKRLELRFQSLSLEIATRHSSHGAKFGERIGPVEDA